MKKKNLLVICSAAALCLICVLLLMGSMGIYAEKSGTKEFEPEITESETSDTLTQILAENSEQNNVQTEGSVPEETLQEIWKKMYEKYAGTEETQKESEAQKAGNGKDRETVTRSFDTEEGEKLEAVSRAEEESVTNAADPEQGDEKRAITLNSAELGVHEAGLVILKEINRLYPEDSLEDLEIDDISMRCDTGTNGQGYIHWEGSLGNGYMGNDEKSISYQFEIDSVTGKIISFGKFHPYQKNKDYSEISWTDEEIKAHAKKLIEKYDLAQGAELDWTDMELYNGTEDILSLKEEFEEDPDLAVAIGNTLIFKKNGKKIFYLSLDWETGEVSDYVWPGHNMPE